MNPYEDMLDLPRHVSKERPHMSMVDRGAQFSPFAALTGYEAVIAETARLTEEGGELTEGEKGLLDEILRGLWDRIEEEPWAIYTCFQKDERKAGGCYVQISGCLKKYDSIGKQLILTDGKIIPIESIFAIETE